MPHGDHKASSKFWGKKSRKGSHPWDLRSAEDLALLEGGPLSGRKRKFSNCQLPPGQV